MDPSLFYGKNNKSNPIKTRIISGYESEDSQLSDSDVDECASSDIVIEENIISENDDDQFDSEDDIALSEIAMQNQKRNKNTKETIWISSGARQTRPILPWKGTLPDPPDKPLTPFIYFSKFVDKDLLNNIVEQSNLYALQCDVNKPLLLTVEELQAFIGIVFLMSIYGLPRTRMFWQRETEVFQVSSTLSRNRWEQIKSKLHFNDNTQHNNEDKLFKIRPFIDAIVNNFKATPMTEKLCVDEQMIPFKGRHQLKVYLKSKPKKWGYKAFVLCGSDGIVYNWELYSGAVALDPYLPDVGVSGNVVLRLSKVIPRNYFHKIYFDNWFNSLKLQVELHKIGIHCLGTVRNNRLRNCSFTNDKEMAKKGRGSIEEKTTIIDGVKLTAIKWYDNKPVHLLSSFIGVHPTKQVQRWDSKSKSKIEIQCPHAVHLYNQFMGGVDLADSLISLYRTSIRSKKWYHKIYFHLMDLCVVNSWLLYKRDCNRLAVPKKEQLSLLQFKSDIAATLCSKVDKNQKKRGRPNNTKLQEEIEKKKTKKRESCSSAK